MPNCKVSSDIHNWIAFHTFAISLPEEAFLRARHKRRAPKNRNLPKWTYCLKYDGLRQSISNIEPIQPGIIGRILVSPIFLLFEKLKDFSLKLKNCISFWKNKNMKWNDFDCSLMWCVSLIWSKCQELKMRHNMLPLD